MVSFGGPLPLFQFFAKENPFSNSKLVVVFPKEEFKLGEFVDVKINS